MTEQTTIAEGAVPQPTAPTESPPALPVGKQEVRTQPLPKPAPGEVGGPKGPEPTRYGDWESKGRASDF